MQAGKWYQIGNPFAELEDVSEIKINDAFTLGFSNGDILNIMDPDTASYSTYFWDDALKGWKFLPTAPILADNAVLTQGQAVYIYKAIAGNVVLRGKVVEASVEFGKADGDAWNQIVVMYPMDVKLNDLTWEGVKSGDIVNILDIQTASYTPYYWNENLKKWAILPTAPIAADVTITPGQALFVNKKSTGVGVLSK